MEWFPWWLDGNKDRGEFGDSFGSINALFAGLAFTGVIWAILLQNAELKLQREELGVQGENLRIQEENLRIQQQILEHQRIELQGQMETLQKQNFESSFFQLLGLHSEIVNSIEFNSTINNQPVTYSGRNYFVYMLSQLRDGVAYKDFFAEHQLHVSHYFRHFYNIVKFVDQSEVNKKKLYTDLIRAQLSTDELGTLFYHGLDGPEDNFKCLIEKYALFEGMLPVLQNEQTELYDTSAYGQSD